MPGKHKTLIFCYDDHRAFSEDVRKRFNDESRYEVSSFPVADEFISAIGKARDMLNCKVAVIGVHDSPEHFELVEKLTAEVKKTDPSTGLILIVPPEKLNEVKKVILFNIDAYIGKNSNTILRVHNTVKKLISEYNISVFRKRRNLSIYILLAFIILSAILVVYSYFRFPGYF